MRDVRLGRVTLSASLFFVWAPKARCAMARRYHAEVPSLRSSFGIVRAFDMHCGRMMTQFRLGLLCVAIR